MSVTRFVSVGCLSNLQLLGSLTHQNVLIWNQLVVLRLWANLIFFFLLIQPCWETLMQVIRNPLPRQTVSVHTSSHGPLSTQGRPRIGSAPSKYAEELP